MNRFRFPVPLFSFWSCILPAFSPVLWIPPSARKICFRVPGEFMGPQLFFSVRHGLQQLQSLHDGGEERSSPVSGPDLQHGPSPVRHYFSNHGVEEKPEAFGPAFSIFLRQKTALHEVVEVQGKDGKPERASPRADTATLKGRAPASPAAV